MSGRFEGFTQDDINQLAGKRAFKTTACHKKGTFSGRNVGIKRIPDALSKLDPTLSPNLTPTLPQEHDNNFIPKGLPDLNISINSLEEESIHFRPLSSKTNNKNSENVQQETDESILKIENLSKESTSNNRENAPSPFRGISLKDFEQQRKLIEEQNKQKKDMLYKAIEVHSQKTAAEVKKIEQIKSELARLDNDLATDVSILRKKIESACLHYSNMQKQYDRIESQFLKAKLDLHNASEQKELLTEHLYTVIAHNESRKAKKLSELMEKVGLTSESQNEIVISKDNTV